MLITPHFLTGLVIAKAIPEASPAILGAVGSHFVLDAIPHLDTIGGHHLNKANLILVFADLALALALWWYLIPESARWYAFAIGISANLPDALEIPGIFWPKWNQQPIMKQFHHWHTQILQYSREPKNWVVGLVPQFVLVGYMLIVLAK